MAWLLMFIAAHLRSHWPVRASGKRSVAGAGAAVHSGTGTGKIHIGQPCGASTRPATVMHSLVVALLLSCPGGQGALAQTPVGAAATAAAVTTATHATPATPANTASASGTASSANAAHAGSLPLLGSWSEIRPGTPAPVAPLVSASAPAPGQAEQDRQGLAAIPALSARVTDRAGMLTAAQRNSLEAVLKEHEQRSGSQVAVLLVGSTAPEAIEQYGIRVADAWKPGRKGVDDGVILIVARDNPASLRRLRIETGRGVQGTLTDAQSKRILQDTIAPHFRQEDFYGGLVAGVSAITALLDQEDLPAKNPDQQVIAGDTGSYLTLLVLGVLIVAGARYLLSGRMRNRHRSLDSWADAGVLIGSGIGNSLGRGGSFGGGLAAGSGGNLTGSFSAGGGSFDGGGASGNW